MLNHKHNKGFTIIELLIVISIIAILATLTIISYISLTSRATTASLQSTLTNNKKLLTNYSNTYGSYPTALDGNYCPTAPKVDNAYCLEYPNGTTLSYTGTISTFSLSATYNSITYKITEGTIATLVAGCPSGFIVVPGSTTYGTSSFCVMKYEAKADDNGDGVGDTNQTTGKDTWPADTFPISASRKLVSSAAGFPVANISQTTASTAASSFTNGCASGCHLITEAEWMTIAQNVLSVPSNWSGGSVGSGYIYSGHNDGTPASALQADANDANGYANTGNASGNQRRTLTLTNGEVIWDFPGNVYEWTAGQTTGNQPGITGENGFTWKEYTAVNASGSLAVNILPSGLGLSGSSSWNSTQGIGQLYSAVDDVTLRGFLRGGTWTNNVYAGLLTAAINNAPSTTYFNFGLRVAK